EKNEIWLDCSVEFSDNAGSIAGCRMRQETTYGPTRNHDRGAGRAELGALEQTHRRLPQRPLERTVAPGPSVLGDGHHGQGRAGARPGADGSGTEERSARVWCGCQPDNVSTSGHAGTGGRCARHSLEWSLLARYRCRLE